LCDEASAEASLVNQYSRQRPRGDSEFDEL